jgi:ABC-type nickel/cobalt efflux system permease component RcnA
VFRSEDKPKLPPTQNPRTAESAIFDNQNPETYTICETNNLICNLSLDHHQYNQLNNHSQNKHPKIVYVTPDSDKIFLSREACSSLGLIPANSQLLAVQLQPQQMNSQIPKHTLPRSHHVAAPCEKNHQQNPRRYNFRNCGKPG